MAKSPPKEQIVVRVTEDQLHKLRVIKAQARCDTWYDLLKKAGEVAKEQGQFT